MYLHLSVMSYIYVHVVYIYVRVVYIYVGICNLCCCFFAWKSALLSQANVFFVFTLYNAIVRGVFWLSLNFAGYMFRNAKVASKRSRDYDELLSWSCLQRPI